MPYSRMPRRRSLAEVSFSIQSPEVKEKIRDLLVKLGVPREATNFDKTEEYRYEALEQMMFEEARLVGGEMQDKAMAMCGRRNDSVVWAVAGMCIQELAKTKNEAVNTVIDTYAPGWAKRRKANV